MAKHTEAMAKPLLTTPAASSSPSSRRLFPSALLAWLRRLIPKRYDGSCKRGCGRLGDRVFLEAACGMHAGFHSPGGVILGCMSS